MKRVKSFDDWIVLVFLGASLGLVGLVLLNTQLGVFYDTDSFGDTLFLLGAGWRANQGLTPVLDFGHFYGGVMAQGIGIAMQFLSYSVFVFDYFTVSLALLLSLIAVAILFGRVSVAGMSALVLTITTLLLTRYPLEIPEPIIRIVSTHSFLYNRYGLAAMIVAGLFVALRPSVPRNDLLQGFLVGVLLVTVALTKPTFAILSVGVLLGLLIQLRFRGLFGVLFGLAAAIFVMDPTLEIWRGSLAYAQEHIGDQQTAQVGALFRKALQVPFAQPVATIFALAALTIILLSRLHIASVLGLVLVVAVGIGMTSTMGGNGSLGQLALPVAIMVSLAAAEIARREEFGRAELLKVMAFCQVAALAVPHSVNLCASMVEGYMSEEHLSITEGPYKRYLSIPERSERGKEGPTQYDMFAEGVETLQALGDPSQWGIIADNGVIFEHALLAKPVPGYPLWQRASAPELAGSQLNVPAADVALIGRTEKGSKYSEQLLSKLPDDFRPCTISRYWTIYARDTSGIDCPSN